MELNIYNQEKELKMTISPADSSTHTHDLMGENVVSISFTYPEFITLDVNDYIELEGVRYILRTTCEPIQKSTLEYTYNVKFFGRESETTRVRMLYLTDGEYETKFSLDGNPQEHLQKVIDNLNRIDSGVWVMKVPFDAPNQTIEYSNVSCAEALSKIAETFDTEWWVEGSSGGATLNLSRCEIGETVELGYMQGLTELTRADNENVPFFTRLFPLGSTRNIDRSKYGHPRLQLPGGAKFVDQNMQYGLYEAVEEQAFAGIYPRRTGTVSSVRTEDKTGENGPFTIYYFKDDDMTFDPNQYELPGLVKSIVFQSGELNGRNFEVNYNSDKKEFVIITQYPDENRQLPGNHLIPKPTDTYILSNISMPSEYITAAEEELEVAVNEHLAKYSVDNAIYRGNTDYVYIENNDILLCVGRRVRLMSQNYFEGTGYRDSRITRITRNLSNLTKATIECTNAVGKGRLAAIESNVNEIKTVVADRLEDLKLTVLRSWDSGDITDANVLSSLRSIREINKRALRKDVADETKHLLKLLGGAEFGEYAPGFTGTGARINEDGLAEMASLRLREFLEVPELRFNRIDVVSGELWNAVAFGLIESVDLDNQVITLKLEEGELLGVQLNDFCRGIFHNLTGNAITEENDACGFSTLPGFSTAYFTPMEILPDGKSFRYALKPATTVHPCKAMKFAVYGNAIEKSRQASSYSTRTYKRYLSGVNTWDIKESNISMQFGDCSGLSIGGVDMSGYSAYLNNIYLTGVIKWLEDHIDDFKGEDGKDGVSTYFHLKYSDKENPTVTTDMTETPSTFIGTYVNNLQEDSLNPYDYNWSRFQGMQGKDGTNGIPGINGIDGQTSYLHIKYSNDGITFTPEADGLAIGEAPGDWIGQYVDFTQQDSSIFSEYTWKKIKGDRGEQGLRGLQGDQGVQGIPGDVGKDGRTSYFHIKYAPSITPTPEQMTEGGAEFIGTYVDYNQLDSTNPTDYQWTRFQGLQGEQGEQGIPGIGLDGKTYYLHIKYSNDAGNSFTTNNGETAGDYIGQYTDENISDSSDVSKYKWAQIKGEQGIPGTDSYAVELSTYDATVTVDHEGKIDKAIYDIMNIAAGEELAYTSENQIVTTRYKVQTDITAIRGTSTLVYVTEIPATGQYSTTITPTGCEFTIANGVITVTKLMENKAVLVINVNCENKVTLQKVFTITKVKDGLVLDWIADWDGHKTVIGGESVISPKIFSGTYDKVANKLTGVSMGRGFVTIDGVTRTGLFGIKDNEVTFSIDSETGDATFGGQVKIAGGKILLNTDGSGQLADGSIWWDKDGNAEFEDVRITGSVRNPFTMETTGFDVEKRDNVVMISDAFGWKRGYNLPWDVNQSGRRLCIINYKWGTETATGYGTISAPSDEDNPKYFFEDGIQKSAIKFSREVIELMGYGDNKTFYGWIVLNRTDISTTKRYGRSLRALAFGRVNGLASDLRITSCNTFDGEKLSVERISTGHYRVTIPTKWGLTTGVYIVMLTGIGTVNSSPVKASIGDCYPDHFDVHTNSTNVINDGAFQFMVINPEDWLYIV